MIKLYAMHISKQGIKEFRKLNAIVLICLCGERSPDVCNVLCYHMPQSDVLTNPRWLLFAILQFLSSFLITTVEVLPRGNLLLNYKCKYLTGCCSYDWITL